MTRRAAALLAAALVCCAGCAAREVPRPPAAAGPARLLQAPIGGGERFVGSAACRGCHPGVFAFWRGTSHAASLRALRGADAANPVCLRCHATAFGDPLGYRDRESTPDLAAVGCEACHGAGADHAGSSHPALVPTATGGDCPPCEVNRVCRGCHTAGQSPGFDLARDLARVACRPAPAGQPR